MHIRFIQQFTDRVEAIDENMFLPDWSRFELCEIGASVKTSRLNLSIATYCTRRWNVEYGLLSMVQGGTGAYGGQISPWPSRLKSVVNKGDARLARRGPASARKCTEKYKGRDFATMLEHALALITWVGQDCQCVQMRRTERG